MEGILWKWTNVWRGWQTRWFVLDGSVLSYYLSQDDVDQGCRGSVNVAACEILAPAVDNTRMDIILPGGSPMFLKAATSQERQQWVIALGCAKACGASRFRRDSGESNPNMLKSKKSELRLYCDLLMHQVQMVKTAALHEGGPELDKMDEGTNLLGATCDTFIKTLEDCMRLSNELPHLHATAADTGRPPIKGKVTARNPYRLSPLQSQFAE